MRRFISKNVFLGPVNPGEYTGRVKLIHITRNFEAIKLKK